MTPAFARAICALRQLRQADGVAAVEFALVLPVMIVMLLGMTEITTAVNTDRKLTLLSRSLADLTSRSSVVDSSGTNHPSEINASGLTNVFAASGVILQPYTSTGIKMVLSSIKVTYTPGVGSAPGTSSAQVAWSCASGTGAAANVLNTPFSPPSGFEATSSSTTVYYVLAETTLPYRPLFGSTITGTITLGEKTPWPVRNGAKIQIKSSSCPTSCNCLDEGLDKT